jgi:hypothetical protein
MKPIKQFIPLLVLLLTLSACGPAATTAASTADGTALAPIYTAAALTLAAQPAAAASTPLPAATATPLASPTLKPTTPTSPNPSAPAAASNSGTTCDNSAYLSDVTIPDGTVFTPGETFTKTWNVQNSGTCAWSTAYSLAFLSGSAMGGSTTALTAAVSSGGQSNVSVALVAPSTAGTYTGYWKLQNAAGTAFGQSVYVQIIVSGSTATQTTTPTATTLAGSSASTSTVTAVATVTTAPTSTSTTAPTVTSAPTNTSAPSETPTPTETPSS